MGEILIMTEKDMEIQKLRSELGRVKKALKVAEEKCTIAKDDLYKAVKYECRCSLCKKLSECDRVETPDYGCFIWGKED